MISCMGKVKIIDFSLPLLTLRSDLTWEVVWDGGHGKFALESVPFISYLLSFMALVRYIVHLKIPV